MKKYIAILALIPAFMVPHFAHATVVYLTSGSTWTVPSGWNSANNKIEVIGGGAGGSDAATGCSSGSYHCGGGGGAYSNVTNVSLTPGATIGVNIGTGGSANSSGGDTYLCNSTSGCSSISDSAVQVGAKGGIVGTGGQASASIGSSKYNGGGSGTGGNDGAPGGGGAAGLNGVGKNGGAGNQYSSGGGGGSDGGSVGADAPTAVNGGNGGNNIGGTGGGSGGISGGANATNGTNGGGGGGGAQSSPGANGSTGTEWDSTHGSGGGGGGSGGGGGTNTTGNGGLYGGGGGEGGYPSEVGGTGGQGIIVITYTPAGAPPPPSNGNGPALSGWAWSSNIGWISFNSDNTSSGGGSYSVNISTTSPCSTTAACLSGYAWSSNIGWIQFGGLAGSQVGGMTTSDATVNMTTGAVSGWIQALSGAGRTDGWDGWIELSGTNHPTGDTSGSGGVTYVPSTGAFKGYAWGSNVIGWLQFSPRLSDGTTSTTTCPECVPNPSALNLTATFGQTAGNGQTLPDVPVNAPVSVDWSAANVTGCTKGGDLSSVPNNVNVPTGDIISQNGNGSITFTSTGNKILLLTCNGIGLPLGAPPLKQTVRVTVGSNSIPITCSKPQGSVACPSPNSDTTPNGYNGSNMNGLYTDSTQCPVSASTNNYVPVYCYYYCPTGYNKKGNSCVKSSIQEF